MWETISTEIATSRHIEVENIDSMINNCIMFSSTKQVLKSGLIDGLCYEREMDLKFATLLNQEKDDLNFISPSDLVASSVNISPNRDHIAVMYAVGEIAESNNAGINWEKIVPTILDLAEDDNVKGLVLRVNSPGGSVFGSQQIADALQQFKKSGKPFAVSMGDYAASGGYWISCDADYIFASPLTITGSIGIFGLIPNAEALLNKIGVNFQTVATNTNGLVMAPFKPLNEAQMAAVQANVEEGYDQFIKRVANGRKMPESKVRAIAEGRVWDGKMALKLGLIDKLGSLQDAVSWVAAKADLKDPEVVTYPKNEPSIWNMVYDLGRDNLNSEIEKSLSNTMTPQMIEAIKFILSRKQELALMPTITFCM
jgi:protease-4